MTQHFPGEGGCHRARGSPPAHLGTHVQESPRLQRASCTPAQYPPTPGLLSLRNSQLSDDAVRNISQGNGLPLSLLLGLGHRICSVQSGKGMAGKQKEQRTDAMQVAGDLPVVLTLPSGSGSGRSPSPHLCPKGLGSSTARELGRRREEGGGGRRGGRGGEER